MSATARIEPAGDGHRVSGELVFATVPGLWHESAGLLAGAGPLELDLSGVSRADSAGLALLVAWTREAHRRGRALRLTGMPEQMRGLARLSGLDGLLPLAPA